MPGLSWRQKLLRLSEKGLAKNTLLLFGITAMSLAIIFSKSRSGVFLLAYTFFLFFGLTALYFRDVKNRDKRIMNILKVVFLVVIVLSIYIGIESTLERFALNEIMQEKRPAIWVTTIQIFTDFPIFGSGLGTFASIYPGLESWGEPINVFHAHNDYLEYLSELGIVGMSMLLGGILLILVNSFLFWKERRHREVKGLALGGMVATICILLHSITDFNLHIPANMMLFSIVVSLTLVIATYRYRKSDEKIDIAALKNQISKIITEKEKGTSV
jgi:O-antigen ligase